MKSELTRRGFIQLGGAAAATAVLGGCSALESSLSPAAEIGSRPRKRTLRIAHLTDTHVSVHRGAPEGIAACLKHVHSLPDRPDVIFTGGDCILDAMSHPEDSVRSQWEVWTSAFREHCTLPVHSCLGNHDIWGWDKPASHTTGKEPLYGKEWARRIFNVKSHHRSFELGGWHIIFLDSMVYDGGTMYYAALDEKQFGWLKADLAAVNPKTPVLVVSHIPILSAAVFYDGNNAHADWIIPRAWMHIDSGRIKDLFVKHPNVRLCLSGHVHLYDRVLYNGVTYICNGSVSGAVWRGPYEQTNPGYGIVDLYNDGSFDNQYVEYGWGTPWQKQADAGYSRIRERSLVG